MQQTNFDSSFMETSFRHILGLSAEDHFCLLKNKEDSNGFECVYTGSCKIGQTAMDAECPVYKVITSDYFFEMLNKTDGSNDLMYNEIFEIPNTDSHSPPQIVIPIQQISDEKLYGLVVVDSDANKKLIKQQSKIARATAFLSLMLLQMDDRDRMISKLELLSDTSNILLSESVTQSLSEKLDFVAKRGIRILDAELCSLWLVDEDELCLKSSYSKTGNVLTGEQIRVPIKAGKGAGLTGNIAHKGKVFNVFGNDLREHEAIKRRIPPEFMPSKKMYSELAYPIIGSKKELLGLLIAYNKIDTSGKPFPYKGFSQKFDEPLMRILSNKIGIYLKNAEQLEKLKKYERIVESISDPVVITSKNGRIQYMNSGAKSIFGDMIGESVAKCYFADGQSNALEKAMEVKKLAMESSGKHLSNHETTFRDKSGKPTPVSLSLSILYDEYGEEAGNVGIAKDLSTLKALVATGQSLLETYDIDEILSQITQTGLGLKDSLRAYIKLLDAGSDSLVCKALSSKKSGDNFPVKSTLKYQGMTGNVFRTQEPYISKNVNEEPHHLYFRIFDDVKSKIVVPITYTDRETNSDRQLGVISIDSDKPGAFSGSDLYFISNLANLAAVALQNANIITSKNYIISELLAFEKVQLATTRKNSNLDLIYDAMLEATVDLLGYKFATISIVQDGMIGTFKGKNVDPEFIKSAWHSLKSKDIQAWVVRHEEPVYIDGPDDRLDKEIAEKYNHQDLVRIFIPIIARGEVLGTIEAGHDKSEKPEITKAEIATLEKLVKVVAIGIERATLLRRLKEDLALRNELERQLDALNQASIQILSSTNEEELIKQMFRSLESIGYSKGMLSLLDDEMENIQGQYAFGKNWLQIPFSETIFALNGQNIIAEAINSKQSILSKNCAEDNRWSTTIAKKAGIKSQYVIPLVVKDEPIGALHIDLSDQQDVIHGNILSFERRMKVLETFANQSAIAIRNIRSIVTIDHLQENIAETAHEFRSPLHNIITQLGGLKDTLQNDDKSFEIDQALDEIEEQVSRASRQVNNSLLASKTSRSSIQYDLQSGFLQDTIASCVNSNKLRALERGIHIIIRDNIKKLPTIKFDKSRMAQAFDNLIDNAVKYSHYHQSVTLSGFDDGTQLHIEIIDRGLGIPTGEYEKIFKGFTRSAVKDKIRYIPGTGIGLKICKEIIKNHGGSISVTSKPLSKNPQKTKEYQDYRTAFEIVLPKVINRGK